MSTILLDEHVDSGPIIARQRYAVPPPETDIDYYYDSVIRADLLISTLKRWSEQGDFEELIEQKRHEGTTDYVIHPVLTHIALNSLSISLPKSACSARHGSSQSDHRRHPGT